MSRLHILNFMIYAVLFLECVHRVCSNLHIEYFKGISGCTDGWISPKYSFKSYTTISVIKCVIMCARTPGCYSVNACELGSGSISCDIIGDVVTGCGDLTVSNACKYMQHNNAETLMASNPCFNGGTWDGGVCHCVWGFAGQWCERLVRSCREAFELGVRGTGFYRIHPFGSPVAYTVYCNCVWVGTIYAFKRTVPPPPSCPPINYNRTWEEYKNGFGDINCEYFLGLETMYQLTRYAIYQWNIYNTLVDYSSDSSIQIENTVLKSEANNYEVNFERVFKAPWEKGDDAFDNSQKPRRFCTWDRDCNGCAQKVGGGWWFTSDCKGGALTAPPAQMVWPVFGVDRIIDTAYLQMDLHGYH